jgi:hypothetical protein
MERKMVERIHPFQAAGLGVAPFRFVGHYESTFQAAPGQPVRAGASCDYCGTAIRDCFKIRSADGREFKVGCDCVEKTCAPGGPIVTAAQKAAKRAKKTRDLARLKERVSLADAALKANPALLANRPDLWNNVGRSLRDSVMFLLERGGASGRTKACKIVELALTVLDQSPAAAARWQS